MLIIVERGEVAEHSFVSPQELARQSYRPEECVGCPATEQYLGELRRKGLRVGVIKHTTRRYPVDTSGKDIWRSMKAAARVSARARVCWGSNSAVDHMRLCRKDSNNLPQ